MDKYVINHSTLVSIGDAVREKEGTTENILVSDLANRIKILPTGGYELPDEALVITGDCQYKFHRDSWNWYINSLGYRVTSNDITRGDYMFNECKTLESIPFDLNFRKGGMAEKLPYHCSSYMFNKCENLKEIKGKIVNLKPSEIAHMFDDCFNLRELPEFVNFDNEWTRTDSGKNDSMFNHCYSLRKIPEELLNKIVSLGNATSGMEYSNFFSMFSFCVALDEIKGLNPDGGYLIMKNTNVLSYTFTGCTRVKDITFILQEDGTPFKKEWKNQVINLANSNYPVGYCPDIVWQSFLLNYNSGITKATEVKDDTTYTALKDNPDWWASRVEYSRYNHDSAVNTINSLPDTSNFGTNTIKFEGESGSKTDGGAINTLTAEEIAVASAKGWTVSFV